MTTYYDDAGSSDRTGHIVLCGLDQLGLRTLEQLRRLGEEVTVVARAPSEEFVLDASELGARIIEGNYRNESALRAAGVVGASAVVILEDDDVGNLHSALTTQEINPNVRIVLRVFDEGFGNKIRTLFRDCSVLSSTAIAAPAFVAAALHDVVEQRLEIGGRSCVVRRAKSDDPDVLLPLVRTVVESDPELFPTEGADLLCLAFDASPSRAAESGRSQGTDGRPHGRPKFWTSTDIAGSVLGRLYVDARLRWLVAILLLLGVASTGIFWLYSELDLVTAFYFMVTVITTTGFGDLRWVESSASLKLYSAFLMLVGTAALTVFYALITDAFVSARLIRTPTPILRRMHDHVIVCGLGNVGYTVVDAIHRSGTPVAAVEIAESDQFLATVRAMGVPVVMGDARLPETLQTLNVGVAQCLVVATNDDVANLETVLNALALNPTLRVVLRLFDPDFAARVERAFNIHISRSVSALAAPAFAAAAVGERVVAVIPFGVQALIVAQDRIEAGSDIEGRTVGELEASTELRVVLCSRGGDQDWRPAGSTILAAEDEIVVVATRRGLAQVFEITQPDDPDDE